LRLYYHQGFKPISNKDLLAKSQDNVRVKQRVLTVDCCFSELAPKIQLRGLICAKQISRDIITIPSKSFFSHHDIHVADTFK
jgi:hypothetical protein